MIEFPINDYSLEQQYEDYYEEENYDCGYGYEEYEEFVEYVEVRVGCFRGLVRKLLLFLLSRL